MSLSGIFRGSHSSYDSTCSTFSSFSSNSRGSYSSTYSYTSNASTPRGSYDVTVDLEKLEIDTLDDEENTTTQYKTEQLSIHSIYSKGQNALRCKKKQRRLNEWKLVDLYFKSQFSQILLSDLEKVFKSGENNLEEKSKEYDKYIKMSNAFSFWVISQILKENTCEKRAKVIEIAIKMARYFLKVGNFELFVTTLGGLGNTSVERLKKTWNTVPKKMRKLRDRFDKLCDGRGNYAKLLKRIIEFKGASYLPYTGVIKGIFSRVKDSETINGWIAPKPIGHVETKGKDVISAIEKNEVFNTVIVSVRKNHCRLLHDTYHNIEVIPIEKRVSQTTYEISQIKNKIEDEVDMNEKLFQKSASAFPIASEA